MRRTAGQLRDVTTMTTPHIYRLCHAIARQLPGSIRPQDRRGEILRRLAGRLREQLRGKPAGRGNAAARRVWTQWPGFGRVPGVSFPDEPRRPGRLESFDAMIRRKTANTISVP